MSDPLSVAASAAGLLSLGIEVYKGLKWYLVSVKGRKEEIQHALRDVEKLHPILSSLLHSLPSIQRKRPVDCANIQKCFDESKDSLLKLEGLLSEWSGRSNPMSARGKIKEFTRAIAFPFREDHLRALRQHLEEVLSRLELSVVITSLNSTLAQEEELRTIGTHTKDLKNDSTHHMELLTLMLEDARAFATTTTNVESRVMQMQKDLEQLPQRIVGLLPVPGKLEVFSPYTDQSTKAQSYSPSQQRTPVQTSMKGPHRGTHSNDLRNQTPLCTCPTEGHSVEYQLGFWGVKFQLTRKGSITHKRHCIYYGVDHPGKQDVKIEIPLMMSWLFTRINYAHIAYTTGNSGCGFSARFKNIVPTSKDPARKELDQIYEAVSADIDQSSILSAKTLETINSHWNSVLWLYRERKASPYDLDERGESHGSKFLILVLELFTLVDPLLKAHESYADTVFNICRSLHAYMSPDDNIIQLGCIVLYADGPSRVISPIAQKFISSIILDEYEFKPKDFLRALISFSAYEEVMSFPPILDGTGIEMSPIHRAVVLRSLHGIEANLHAVMDIKFGITVLHLSATWPEGLQRLLRTEAKTLIDAGFIDESKPRNPLTPFILAADNCRGRVDLSQNIKSLDILLQAGCTIPLGIDHTGFYMDQRFEIIDVIASHLATRRMELVDLAMEKFALLRTQNVRHVTDSLASRTCKLLRFMGHSVPPHLEVPPGYSTIYHQSEIPLNHFPIYFHHGFRSCNTHNSMGLTPVAVWRKIYVSDCVDWLPWLERHTFLDNHQKDPRKLGLNVLATGWHYFAAQAGWFFEYYSDIWNLAHKLSDSEVRDDCLCWCNDSEKGCSPASWLWKAKADRKYNDNELKTLLSNHLIYHPSDHDVWTLNNTLSTIRFLTFEALEMKHTCCFLKKLEKPDKSSSQRVIARCSKKSVHMIRSSKQEREKSCQLASLMAEFESKLKDSRQTYSVVRNFIWGYWRQRMAEVLAPDPQIINDMEQVLNKVETYVVPRRLKPLLGREFGWLGREEGDSFLTGPEIRELCKEVFTKGEEVEWESDGEWESDDEL